MHIVAAPDRFLCCIKTGFQMPCLMVKTVRKLPNPASKRGLNFRPAVTLDANMWCEVYCKFQSEVYAKVGERSDADEDCLPAVAAPFLE